jgi:hypothetical protein
MRRFLTLHLAVLATSFAAVQAAPLSPPRSANVKLIGNHGLTAAVKLDSGKLSIDTVEDTALHASIHPTEAFVLVLENGRELRSSTMDVQGGLESSIVTVNPSASRQAEHEPGHQLCANLIDKETSTRVHWCMVSRGQQPYLRQEITIQAPALPLALTDVQLFRFHDPSAHVVGSVAGSPIVTGNFYLGFEHPLSYTTTVNGEVIAGLKRTLPLAAGQSITYTSVIGAARPGQLRRDFLAYLEQERAHPYRTFLHYNTWYDIGYGERFDQAAVLNRIHAFGEELVRKRNVRMDSFLMDDGWDNTSSLWDINSGFPNGLAPVRAAAAKYGFGIGIWMSPWGGYQKEKQERIAFGKSQGYEIVDGGYALSGPRYYAKFEQTCLNFVKRDGVNQFKFDGTGNAGQVFPGSLFDSDFSAAIHLVERIRRQNSQVFINLTTGTKPSPFWLRYADSIWRSGEDHAFTGEGTWRQKWITYRDAQTYRNIVQGGPLFPLNSLMLHGILYAAQAEHLSDDPSHDFTAEVHSYFGSGTQLQEMYITPSLLTPSDWDTLAESANWSRRNASILRDTHWIGGDPAKAEPYGWASWNANAGIIVLRNPSSHPQHISIDVQTAFELPSNAKPHYTMHSPWATDANNPSIDLTAHQPHTFDLHPFEVLTLQSAPNP